MRFFAFLAQAGLDKYAGGISPRNAFESRWYTNFDLRIQQEIPIPIPVGFLEDSRATLFLDVENLGNLLDKDWGRLEQVRFEYFQPVTEATINANGQYVYNDFDPSRGLEGQNSEKTDYRKCISLANPGWNQVRFLI